MFFLSHDIFFFVLTYFAFLCVYSVYLWPSRTKLLLTHAQASLASFNFLEASRLGEPIVTVDGNGQISAKSLQTQGSASVKGSLNVQGPAILGGMGASVAPGDSIVIDPCAANTKVCADVFRFNVFLPLPL